MLKFWKLIKNIVVGLFSNAFDNVKKWSFISVEITNKIKFFVEHPVIVSFLDLLPKNEKRDTVVKIREAIIKAAKHNVFINGLIVESENEKDLIIAIVKYIKGLNEEQRKSFWVTFSAELNQNLNDGEVTFSEAVIMAQYAYNESKNK
jgi:hypothetical protein